MTGSTPSPSIGSTALAVAVLISPIPVAFFLLLPLLVGATVDSLGFTSRQAGLMSAAMMLAAAISAVSAIFWVRRVNWRIAAAATLGTSLLGYFLAIAADGFAAFVLALALIGLSGGCTYSLLLTIFSDTENPERSFGFTLAVQVSFQVIGLLLVPSLTDAGGIDALLALLAGLNVLALVSVWWLPAMGRAVKQAPVWDAVFKPGPLLGLMGCFFFFFNIGCYWTYIELIGRAGGLESQAMATALAGGVSVGVLGALSAPWLGRKIGAQGLVIACALGTILSIGMLLSEMNLIVFAASAGLYNYVWNASLAYQYAIVNAADVTGRSVAATPAFHAIGGAAGPATAAMFISGQDFTVVYLLISGAVIVSAAMLIGALRLGSSSHEVVSI